MLLSDQPSVEPPSQPDPLVARVHGLEQLVARLLLRTAPLEPARKPLSPAQMEQRRAAARYRARDLDGRFL